MDILEMRVFLAFCALFMVLAMTPARAQSPFQASGNTVSLAVTGTTGRVAVAVDAYNSAIRVYNAGTVPVFINCGDVTVTAVLATSVPVAPGSVEVLGCGKGYIAGIVTTGTATIYLTPGAGI
jgi:hypothetical protein